MKVNKTVSAEMGFNEDLGLENFWLCQCSVLDPNFVADFFL